MIERSEYHVRSAKHGVIAISERSEQERAINERSEYAQRVSAANERSNIQPNKRSTCA
jgi:hypothetical protein